MKYVRTHIATKTTMNSLQYCPYVEASLWVFGPCCIMCMPNCVTYVCNCAIWASLLLAWHSETHNVFKKLVLQDCINGVDLAEVTSQTLWLVCSVRSTSGAANV